MLSQCRKPHENKKINSQSANGGVTGKTDVGDNQVQIGANLNKRNPGVFCSILYNLDFCPTLIYFVLSSTMREYGFLMPVFLKAKGLKATLVL